MTIYISGPITGNPNYQTQFADAENQLRALGHQVINPAAQGTHPGWEWRDYMRRDLIIILTRATGLALLPGWADSKGADLEVQIAKAFGIPVKTVEGWALVDAADMEIVEFLNEPEFDPTPSVAEPGPTVEDPAVAALREKFLNPTGTPEPSAAPQLLDDDDIVNLDDQGLAALDQEIGRQRFYKGDLLGTIRPGHKCRWLYSPETSQYDCEDCGQTTNNPDKEPA